MEALQKPVTSFLRAAALRVTSGFYGMCVASGGNPFLPDKLQAKVFSGTLPPPLQCAGACGSDPKKKRPGKCQGQPYTMVEEEGTQYHFAQQIFIPCSLVTQVAEHKRPSQTAK